MRMNQIKTGKFIAQMRKEKGMTQRQLADELLISDKTVSKWETGKGMPEVSLMMPLCEVLGINVNELLTGERIPDESYKEKAEETMMDLMRNKKGRGKIIALMILILLLMLAPMIIVAVLIEMYDLPEKLEIITLIPAIIGAVVIIFVDCSVGYYQCEECGEKFVPKFGANYFFAFHKPDSRKIRCPKCGKNCWCKHNLY
ncbi:MAG: helix-turn-helix transcriptional regulator [Ruminococcus sp.]|nr:helix-turn-helix transcriptional regulator [Ruminococcus sp.]